MNLWILFFNMITHSGPCEMIANDRIVGEDLAKALPIFLNKIPGDAVIGYSPMPGTRRDFTSAELQRIGAPYGVAVAQDAKACFEWSLQPLTNDVVRAAIRDTLQSPDVRVDVLAISGTQAPAGKVSFPISGLLASTLTGPETPVTWRGEVLYRGSRKFSVWARVKISASVTRRAVRIGLPFFRSELIEPFQVQRGDLVDVTAIAGAAQLHVPALAQTPGRQGDLITLKNAHSGKYFRARIEGKDKALVLAWPFSEPTMPQPTRVQ